MKQLFSLLLILLIGCTGSQEEQPPLLLILGHGEAGSGKLSLIEDNLFSQANSEQRFVQRSEIPLADNTAPVAYDVINRNSSRSELLVLSKGAADNSPSYLSFYTLERINPENPSSFARLKLINLADLNVQDELGVPSLCPVDAQIDSQGRYVALLTDASTCTIETAKNALYILDLEAEGGPAIIRRNEASIIAAGMFMQQTPEADRLFFFSDEAGGSRLRQFNFADLRFSDSTIDIPSFNKPIKDSYLLDNQLVVLQDDQFTLISELDSDPSASEPLDSNPGSLSLIPNNTATGPLFILGQSEFTLHPTFDSEAQSANFTATSGSFEPNSQFVYFISQGGLALSTFDVLRYNPETDSVSDRLRSDTVSLADVAESISYDAPVFITWTRSVLLPSN